MNEHNILKSQYQSIEEMIKTNIKIVEGIEVAAKSTRETLRALMELSVIDKHNAQLYIDEIEYLNVTFDNLMNIATNIHQESMQLSESAKNIANKHE